MDIAHNFADNDDILSKARALARAYGQNFIPQTAPFTDAMLQAGFELAMACGVPSAKALTLRGHELHAFYMTALSKRGPDAARKLALKYGSQAPQPFAPQAPSPQAPQGQDTAILLDLVRDAATKTATDMVAAGMEAMPALVAAELAKLAPRKVEIVKAKKAKVILDHAHVELETVIATCQQGIWPFLVGPAGSGKTTIAEQVAKALGVPYGMAAKVDTKSELLGYRNPHDGTINRTPFRECYEHGGLFLLDEVDGCNPNALTAFNAALSNGHCPFPEKLVARHPDFVCIAAGNTYGKGADRQYVGRNPLDAAFLNRFAVLDIDYDEQLERAITGNRQWCLYVQAVRAYVMAHKLRVLVTPRASLNGTKLIDGAGMAWSKAAQMLIFAGMSQDEQRQVKSAVDIAAFEAGSPDIQII